MADQNATLVKQSSIHTDDDDDDKQDSDNVLQYSKLSGETRRISIPEAIGLDFHSFIPQADITSQVHFFSNIQADSQASTAGLKDGDRILQINGVNVTNLEHEDVRKLMQLMTPIIFTVANDSKYLLLLEQPVDGIEEKSPELPVTSTEEGNADAVSRQVSRFELTDHPSLESASSTLSITKSRRWEIFDISQPDESSNEEPLKAKVCHLRRNKKYDGFGLVLTFQQHLHLIGEVEEMSPSYRAGLRKNDVIVFVGKTNVEKLLHDDVKVMIRATTLASNEVDLTVLRKSDIPRYRILQEKGLVNWSAMGLEK